jgi:hypothetical protein
MKDFSGKDAPSALADPSPLDAFGNQGEIEGFVVDTGEGVRVHGFDVHEDLARHYGFAEVILLTLLGEPPDEDTGRAFGVAMIVSSPVSIAEAPAHAARVAHVSGSDGAGVVSLAAISLGEQVRWLFSRYNGFLGRLESPNGEVLPEEFRAQDAEERWQVEGFRGALPGSYGADPIFDDDPGFWPAVLAILFRCGLRRREHLLTVLVASRLVSTVAEGFAGESGALASYPVNLPPMSYRRREET